MRNPKFELTPAQQRQAERAREWVEPFTREDARQVSVTFTKRNGEPRTILGRALEITGEGSSENVKVMTDDGVRSANLWAIYAVSNV